MSDDASLVQRAQSGDRAAMDQLLRNHYDRVYAVCRRITGHDADAADAAQEALIAIVRSLDRFDGRSSVSTWIYRIATNASLDELRRRRRRPVASLDDPSGRGTDTEHSVLGEHHGSGTSSARADPRAAARVEAIADRLELDAALAALADDFRLPVILRDVGDLDYAEIAETLGIPIGTVKSRIARGRSNLAQMLQTRNQNDPAERPTS